MTKSKALYAGSFDPFTNGHLSIFWQAKAIFDVVYIALANNPDKRRAYSVNDMEEAIYKTLADAGLETFIITSNELVSDIAARRDIPFLVRGLRNPNDYNYEENIAKVNRQLNPQLRTVYFRADGAADIISSSMVKELFSYGKDVSEFVSPHVLKVMEARKCPY